MSVYEVVIRLALAVVVGGLIGYEREFKNRPAGFRTHILVCLGAAITSMIQLYSIQETTKMILQHPELQSAMKVDIKNGSTSYNWSGIFRSWDHYT